MRFLAYGSVPQFGFIALSIQGDSICQKFSILYLLFYLNALLRILLFIDSIKVFESIIYLTDLYIVNKNSNLKFYLLSIVLELGGLPPSNLFFIKFCITGFYLQFYLVQTVLFLLLTILMCFYYLRLVKIIFYEMEENLYFSELPKIKITENYLLQIINALITFILILNV
jgi:NADH-quinone oxidoreductase subunit N